MQLTLELAIPPLPKLLHYGQQTMLIGSCFTEHISDRLSHYRFPVLSNPNGILFNPLSVAGALQTYLDGKIYTAEDLFYQNELWNCWDYHTRFSHIDKETALEGINQSQREAAAYIKTADWLFITLGSAFQYYHIATGKAVSNNHRSPGQWFERKLLETGFIKEQLSATLNNLIAVNPSVQIIFTISPVRHIREGIIENNRSKARLIDAVHDLCQQYGQVHYFPSYELLIDILRDYRYYDIDFVHPNYMATSYVWEQFSASCIAPEAHAIMKEVNALVTSWKHRPRFPETNGHKKFLQDQAEKTRKLMEQYPFLDMAGLLDYFEGK